MKTIGQRKKSVSNTLPVIEMRKRNPCATLQAIGDEVGITREAVRQILNKAGLPTKKYFQTYLCNQCGNETRSREGKNKFCSLKCYWEYCREHNKMTVFCNECGKPVGKNSKEFISRIKKGINSPDKKFYCNRVCWGRWASKHYKFRKKTS